MITVRELREFREREGRKRGLGRPITLDAAAAMVVDADGNSPTRSTWYGWERSGVIPPPRYMRPLIDLVGASSDIFYPSPAPETPMRAPGAQPMLV